MNKEERPKVVSPIEVDLGKSTPALAEASEFRGDVYLSLRFTYETDTGELRYAKNGVSVRIEHGLDAIKALLDVYNQSTGSNFRIEG